MPSSMETCQNQNKVTSEGKGRTEASKTKVGIGTNKLWEKKERGKAGFR